MPWRGWLASASAKTRPGRGDNAVRRVLDTSAILAHYFDEPGADAVAEISRSGSTLPGISAVTVIELRGRLYVEAVDRDIDQLVLQES